MAPPSLGVVAHEDGTVSIEEVDEELHPTLQDRLEYLLLRLLGFSASLLPRFLALALAWLIGVFFFEFLRIRRGVTISNLRQAFSDESSSWHRRTARAAYVNLAVVSVEMLRAHSLDTGKVNTLVHLDGETERRLREVLDSSTGAVFVSGHYGTWELLGARIAALGYPSIAIMQDQRNPLMNRELNDMRGELGLEVVERRVAPKRVMKTLREGGLVLIVGDQDAGTGSGIFVDFFSRPASTAGGPARFAVKSGAVFLGVWIHREKRGYRMGFDELEKMETVSSLPPDADPEERVTRMTEAYMQWLEERIRVDPGQYLWLHRRWKSRPAGEKP